MGLKGLSTAPEPEPYKPTPEEVAEEVAAHQFEPIDWHKPVSFERVLSTGSTLLDLAISGQRIHGGGMPGGIMAEISGRPSTGKTAILAELCACAHARKPPGDVNYQDPEGRLSAEYQRIYRM